ncbi:carbon-monoxide dehydrogenase medium subunit [Actinomycetospora succinea]|uniref:Carbon-monoxide dehydrogenase medium subunit n=1 Tax=Actinomycetospora succinea TaxID=663603 RepID=A0A4R6VS62_9PSEU|nr:FAD binding domain-containing protein [Actinomycetospora succinea]TDQ65456.1 carbon-monoxide dehydrogenase medium subunit [Actinomycetospora succinea]
MKCPPFSYHRATSVDDAVAALAAAGGEGKILAGGQSLVPVLALRLARPDVIVDVDRVPGLDGLELRDGVLHAGALVRHLALAGQALHPLAAEAARWIGHTAIRSRGTLAGSLAHADPAAELPAVLRACDGAVHVAGPSGTRRIGADDLFVGALQSALEDTEMITGVELPVPDAWGFAEFARRHGDFAVVSVAAARFGDRLRVVVGGVAGVPHLVDAGDLATVDGEISEDRVAILAAAAADDVDPADDLHGSARYRRALTEQMTARALEQLTTTVREPA